MHALRDAGLDVPGDVSVVGFDDIPEAAHFWPPLTTVRQDFDEFGRRCIALLLAAIRGIPAEERALVPDLVVRASTAPPRAR
jgi:DNA-binding LacI/PurR family transcriptional regulator